MSTKKINFESVSVFAILGCLFIFFFLLCYFSESTYDTGDGLRHYLVSRYSWAHPEQFLYSWGKPFFTFVSSPFSQFGLIGTNVFNILCALFSGWICYLLAKEFQIKNALLVIFFLCFAVSYFPTLNSGLTEPFFGFLLIAGIYLAIRKHYISAAILISFLPYVRSEGYLIMPLFALIFLFRKNWLAIPLLATGSIVLTVVGYIHYDDILWIKNQNPYTGQNSDIYGSGELLHFVKNYDMILGVPLTILFVAGIVFLIYSLFRMARKSIYSEQPFIAEEVFLIYGSVFIYFAAHSIFWWKGIVGSLGLIRVMAGIIPPAAFVCLRGVNFIFSYFKLNGKIQIAASVVIGLWIVSIPFQQTYFPFRLDGEQKVIKKTADWLQTTNYLENKIYYIHPFLGHALSLDVFDEKKVGELWGLYPSIRAWGIQSIPQKTIVVWDAHFGPNECRIPLDTLLSDSHFKLLKSFKPDQEFNVLGGYPFGVYVFIKEEDGVKAKKRLVNEFWDFEKPDDLENTQTLSNEKSLSGNFSSKLSPQVEYSATLSKNITEYPEFYKIKNIHVSAAFYATEILDSVYFVLSIDNSEGKNTCWIGKDIKIKKTNIWEKAEADFEISTSSVAEQGIVKIYVWNKAKKNFYFDDLEVKYGFGK